MPKPCDLSITEDSITGSSALAEAIIGTSQLAPEVSGTAAAGHITGTATLGSTPAPYSLSFGAMVGNLWFDTDTNNDQVTDSAATLDAWWHYGHETAVAGGQFDIYTVGLHEILHAIGFSSSTV